MQLYICLCIALVPLTSAKQIEIGPPILYEKSSFEPSQKIDKRFVTPEFNLYLLPEQVKAIQSVKAFQNSAPVEALNSGISQASFNELIQKYYAENLKPAPIKEPQEEAPASNIFLPRGESVYNKNQNFNIYNYRQLLNDQNKLSGQAHNLRQNKFNQLPNPSLADSDLVSNNPDVAKEQDEKLLQKQLSQQWVRILDHNKNQLKGIFFAPEKQQISRGYADQVALLKSDPNSNENQKKSVLDKELEFILRNGQNYQSRQLFFPNQVNIQNGRNVNEEKSAIEKEIENVWRQHQAFEFDKSNAPAKVGRQSLSVGNGNQGKSEEDKFEYILRNGQVYGLRKNFPAGINDQGVRGRNEEQNDSEVEREIDNFWRPQQGSQFQRSYVPAGVINRSPLGRNENQGKSEVDKQIENILKQQAFVFEKSNVGDVRDQSPSGRNVNQDNSEVEKQIEFILRSHEAEFKQENAPEIKNQGHINGDQNKSDVEKEIQNILKEHQDFEIQRSKETAEAINQSPPILVHKHISIIKHRPVPVIKNVQVPVPTPVLVPIPQPYEVKVPQLYPVPLKVVKHVPVPVVGHY